MATIHPNLKEERSKISFNLDDMSDYIYGSNETRQRFIGMLKTLSNDPVLQNHPSDHVLGRTESMKKYAVKTARLHEVLDVFDHPFHVFHFPEILLGRVHQDMFVPTIKFFGTAEQQEKWLKKACDYELVGAYAQTELGHGSDVRNLETTAIFDPKTDEFIIHTPTITAAKWWPGELGKVGNACITFAQLIINGKKYGVHSFMVPLRDSNTWKPYPGITVGDIGPKFGYNTKDNGFLKFDNYRIPRENMLMRYSKVNREGEYSKPANDKFAYAIMMYVRMAIVNECWFSLAKALTITVRYNLVRTQFKDEKGHERKVLDYQTQMDKLIPLIASAYTFNAGGMKIKYLYEENLRRIREKEDFGLLADLHGILSGSKSFWTWHVAAGLEVARMACGGHGYSYYSGHPQSYVNFVANCTLEGENTVMALQSARFLIRNLSLLQQGKELSKTVSYLSDINEIIQQTKSAIIKPEDITLESISKTLKMNTCFWVYTAGAQLQNSVTQGLKYSEAWDKTAGIELVEAARSHIAVFSFTSFQENLQKAKGKDTQAILTKLCLLFGIQHILTYPGGLLESGYLNGDQLKLLRVQKAKLLDEIRPDALGLVEAFEIPDNTLNSAIGKYDGQAYETLWKWANESNDWNKKDVLDGYLENLERIQKARKKHPMPQL